MGTLTIEGSGVRIPVNPAVSLLNLLLMNGVPISHRCGGKAQCGTCRIEILSGERFLNPAGESERTRLAASGGREGERLACRTYARGDVSIRIPKPPVSSASAGPARSGDSA